MLNNAGTRSKNARIAQIDKEGTDDSHRRGERNEATDALSTGNGSEHERRLRAENFSPSFRR